MSYCWNDSRGRRGRVNSEYAASYQVRTVLPAACDADT
jgi:hypothetical protein